MMVFTLVNTIWDTFSLFLIRTVAGGPYLLLLYLCWSSISHSLQLLSYFPKEILGCRNFKRPPFSLLSSFYCPSTHQFSHLVCPLPRLPSMVSTTQSISIFLSPILLPSDDLYPPTTSSHANLDSDVLWLLPCCFTSLGPMCTSI